MRYLIVLVLILLPACVGKHKSLCIDVDDGGNAHIELGYMYDESSATVTGPVRLSTMTDDAPSNPCVPGTTP